MQRRAAALFLLLVIGCVSAPPRAAHVVVVSTTDLHGWYAGHPETSGSTLGGLPILAGYIDELRHANDAVVVVDSGDLFQGTLESNLFEGEPVVRGYNQIGYAAVAVGNHEFDYGPLGPDVVAHDASEDPFGALERNVSIAKFPFLSANTIERATGKTPPWARRDVMVSAGGARIGIIGLTTPDTPNTTMAANVASLEFTDPVPATITAAKELRDAGADAVIVIAHMGGKCEDMQNPADVASCDPTQEANRFLARVPPGTIDAYFGGHTHQQMRQIINGVPAVEPMAYGREFSTLDLWVDTKVHRVTKSELRPLTKVAPGSAPADATVSSILTPFLQQVQAKRDEKIGVTTALPVTRAYQNESAMGDLLADAVRAATGADIGFVNSGGIRNELPAGEITYGELFGVMPFDNFPAVVELSGREITEILRVTANSDRGFMQVSGLRYVVDMKAPDHLVSVTLADGSPLAADHLYRVGMPDFIAAGGDGTTPVMSKVPPERIHISYGQTIRDAMIAPLRSRQQPIMPSLDGRITVLNAAK